jgi:hypothetical protein
MSSPHPGAGSQHAASASTAAPGSSSSSSNSRHAPSSLLDDLASYHSTYQNDLCPPIAESTSAAESTKGSLFACGCNFRVVFSFAANLALEDDSEAIGAMPILSPTVLCLAKVFYHEAEPGYRYAHNHAIQPDAFGFPASLYERVLASAVSPHMQGDQHFSQVLNSSMFGRQRTMSESLAAFAEGGYPLSECHSLFEEILPARAHTRLNERSTITGKREANHIAERLKRLDLPTAASCGRASITSEQISSMRTHANFQMRGGQPAYTSAITRLLQLAPDPYFNVSFRSDASNELLFFVQTQPQKDMLAAHSDVGLIINTDDTHNLLDSNIMVGTFFGTSALANVSVPICYYVRAGGKHKDGEKTESLRWILQTLAEQNPDVDFQTTVSDKDGATIAASLQQATTKFRLEGFPLLRKIEQTVALQLGDPAKRSPEQESLLSAEEQAARNFLAVSLGGVDLEGNAVHPAVALPFMSSSATILKGPLSSESMAMPRPTTQQYFHSDGMAGSSLSLTSTSISASNSASSSGRPESSSSYSSHEETLFDASFSKALQEMGFLNGFLGLLLRCVRHVASVAKDSKDITRWHDLFDVFEIMRPFRNAIPQDDKHDKSLLAQLFAVLDQRHVLCKWHVFEAWRKWLAQLSFKGKSGGVPEEEREKFMSLMMAIHVAPTLNAAQEAEAQLIQFYSNHCISSFGTAVCTYYKSTWSLGGAHGGIWCEYFLSGLDHLGLNHNSSVESYWRQLKRFLNSAIWRNGDDMGKVLDHLFGIPGSTPAAQESKQLSYTSLRLNQVEPIIAGTLRRPVREYNRRIMNQSRRILTRDLQAAIPFIKTPHLHELCATLGIVVVHPRVPTAEAAAEGGGLRSETLREKKIATMLEALPVSTSYPAGGFLARNVDLIRSQVQDLQKYPSINFCSVRDRTCTCDWGLNCDHLAVAIRHLRSKPGGSPCPLSRGSLGNFLERNFEHLSRSTPSVFGPSRRLPLPKTPGTVPQVAFSRKAMAFFFARTPDSFQVTVDHVLIPLPKRKPASLKARKMPYAVSAHSVEQSQHTATAAGLLLVEHESLSLEESFHSRLADIHLEYLCRLESEGDVGLDDVRAAEVRAGDRASSSSIASSTGAHAFF